MSVEQPLIIICGPTGVGKSALVLKLAETLNAEIISADAGQVYQGFDIGTAKPGAKERAEVPHHCIDLWAPTVQSDAVLWAAAADQAIEKIRQRGKRPLIVGGTGFYLKALVHGVFPSPDPDPALRQRLQAEFAEAGGQELHQRLQAVDPESAAQIHPNDPVRLVRALEYYEQTGKRISEERAKHHFQEMRYQVVQIGLTRDRDALYNDINQRVVAMMSEGWREEAYHLYNKWGGEIPAFQMIGYRQLRESFEGRLAETDVVTSIQQASRHYAKRQLTWFRSDESIQWVDSDEGQEDTLHRVQEIVGLRKHLR